MRYVLSPYFNLKKLGYLQKKMPNTSEVTQLDKRDTFILIKDGKKDYLINKVIYRFLKFLQSPRSLVDLQAQFPKEAQLVDFLQRMLEKNVIIKEEKFHQLPLPTIKNQRFNVGDSIGKYSVTHLLLKKKKVEIYLAKHQQKVIIKALTLSENSPLEKQNLFKTKFSQEFKLMKSLPKHPHLSQLIQFNKKEAYAVLKFVKGKTLQKFLKKRTHSAPTKTYLIQQIISTLAFLHKHQVVHGDLHHRNIIVAKSLKVTIIDFGLSHLQNSTPIDKLRKGGLDVYLPPERISQSSFNSLNKPADYASDIYQLGILIYLIIFEKFPFVGFTWDHLYEAIQKGAVDYTLKENALFSFLPLIKKCLQKNPTDRFKDANAIIIS